MGFPPTERPMVDMAHSVSKSFGYGLGLTLRRTDYASLSSPTNTTIRTTLMSVRPDNDLTLAGLSAAGREITAAGKNFGRDFTTDENRGNIQGGGLSGHLKLEIGMRRAANLAA
jgi:hypothetical protein